MDSSASKALNNFEVHDRAVEKMDTTSPYDLARQVVNLEQRVLQLQDELLGREKALSNEEILSGKQLTAAARSLVERIPVLQIKGEETPTSPASYPHLRWMLDELVIGNIAGAQGRAWIGCVQGVLMCDGHTTLKAERDAMRPIFKPDTLTA